MGLGLCLSLTRRQNPRTNDASLTGPNQADPYGNQHPNCMSYVSILTFPKLARRYSSVLEKILEAYKSIAEHLPRVDKLQTAFGEVEDFRKVLGFIYKDIAEFHQRAYRFLRRRGWAALFAFDWGLFERRFKSLLASIAFRFELVDREAAAIHFGDMKKARDLDRSEYEKEDRQRQLMMFEAVRSWLSAAEDGQEEFLTDLADKRQPGTCNWILEQEVMKAWVESTEIEPLVWLTGKPGGGKSILASFLVQHLQSRKETTVVYFFCALNSKRITCAEVLRTLAFQALQQNPDLASLVHQAYLQKVSTRSVPKMKGILKEMFAVAQSVHLVIDGVDECERTTQQEILKALSDIQRNSKDIIKILISSRLEGQISEPLPTKAHVSLNGQTDGAIKLYVGLKLKEIQDWFPDISELLLGRIEKRMSDLAQGMFLWVYLVTAMLKDQASEFELEHAVEQLPDGLDAVYGRILDRFRKLPEHVRTRVYKVLSWACAASRAVKVQEVADGVTLRPGQATVLNKKTRIHNIQRDIIDVCAPLVERSAGGYLEIVHFSAKEFLLDLQSGPFVEVAQAHFDIGFSCLSSLTSAFVILPLLSPDTTEQEIESLMVQGYFSLHAYAHDYWAHHLTEYFQNISSLEKAVPRSYDAKIIIELLNHFTRVRKGYLGSSYLDSTYSLPGVHPGPVQLSQFPHLSGFIEEWTSFKNRLTGAETGTDTIEAQLENQLHQDPTFLSLIAQKVTSIKEKLIRLDPANLPLHIDQEDFTSFRKELGTDVFQCRYGNCKHFSSSLQQRLEHENTHRPSFPCVLCDLSGRGFRCRRDLDRHVKQYHCSDEDGIIPDSLTSIFERGQGAINTPNALHYASLSSREPSRWNEKGRKALQSTFKQVYKALALHEPGLAGKTGLNGSSGTPGQLASPTAASSIFASIGQKIDAGQYQTLRDFKTDVNCLSQSIQSREYPEDLEMLQSMLDKALEDTVNVFPDFTCGESQARLQHNIERLLDVEIERSSNSDNSHMSLGSSEITSSQTQSGCKPIFWSKLEESELPSLLAQYGRDFSQIADFLKTKAPSDVEEHFNLLVSSGRQDLAELVSLAEARLRKEQEESTAIRLDANTSDLATVSPNEWMMDAETPDQGCSSKHSASPAHMFPDSASAMPYFPVSETAPTYPALGHASASKASSEQPLNQVSEDVDRPKKYRRRAPPPAYCHHCKNGPRQLRDEHTLQRHIARIHSPFRKVWICIDVSIDKNMLAKCKSCYSGVRYTVKQSAVTHLRNHHFGQEASEETLARWMEKVEEPNPNHPSDQVDAAAESEKLPSIPSWIASNEYATSEASEKRVSKEIPLLEVSFDDILQGYSGGTTPDGTPTPRPMQDRATDTSTPHLAHQGLIRLDHVDKLPNLSGPRKAVTRDQVATYYDILSESDVKSKRYKEALANLKGLSQRLLKDLRDWRRDLTYAPEIRPSF